MNDTTTNKLTDKKMNRQANALTKSKELQPHQQGITVESYLLLTQPKGK